MTFQLIEMHLYMYMYMYMYMYIYIYIYIYAWLLCNVIFKHSLLYFVFCQLYPSLFLFVSDLCNMNLNRSSGYTELLCSFSVIAHSNCTNYPECCGALLSSQDGLASLSTCCDRTWPFSLNVTRLLLLVL